MKQEKYIIYMYFGIKIICFFLYNRHETDMYMLPDNDGPPSVVELSESVDTGVP